MENYQLSIKSYPSYKDSGIEWLGDVPEHWKIKRVKDIVKRIGNGVTPRGGSEVYTDSGIIFLRSQNVYDDGLRIDNVSFIPEQIHEEMKSSQLKTGDILINITGASISRTCLFPLKSGSANINQHITFLRTKSWVDEFYISLFLKSHFIKNHIEIEQSGASKEAFNLSQISNIPLVLPSQTEQKTIAHYLGTKTAQIDRKIDLFTQKATRYSNLKQSLINETVTRGLDKSVPMKDSAIEWIGEVPEHWAIDKLKRITDVKRGASPRPIDDLKYFDDINGDYAWVRIEDVTKSNKYLLTTKEKLSTLGASKSVKMKSGDIFLSIAGSVGKPIISTINCCIHDGFVYFVGLRQNSDFTYYVFNCTNIYAGLGKIGTQLNLNTEIVGGISIPIPPLSEQKAIADYLDTKTTQIDQIIQTINTQIEKLKELRKTLINDVVTGKIKVINE